MNKLLILFVALIGFQINASSSSSDERIEFLGTDDVKYFLRPATADDIDRAEVGIGDGIKADRKERVARGHFGVFIIETEDRKYAGKLLTGRMPLGVQPWPCVKDSPDYHRLSIISNFYEWLLLSMYGVHANHSYVARSTSPDMPVMLINNEMHAATIVAPVAPFNTVAVQDALVVLDEKLNYSVPADTNITPAGRPLLVISISKTAPKLVDGSPSRVFRLPYYKADAEGYTDVKGMFYTTVTSIARVPNISGKDGMDGRLVPVPELSPNLVIRLAAYEKEIGI